MSVALTLHFCQNRQESINNLCILAINSEYVGEKGYRQTASTAITVIIYILHKIN
jgi:hypothetical protein